MGDSMTFVLALICVGLAMTFIEIRDRIGMVSLHWRMNRNAMSLMRDLRCAQCGCQNANHDYRK